jgi:hypothetical protein
VAADAADAAAAAGSGAADEDALVVGLDAPGPRVAVRLGPRPRELGVEDVALRQAEVALEVDRRLDLDAGPAVASRAMQSRIGSSRWRSSRSR